MADHERRSGKERRSARRVAGKNRDRRTARSRVEANPDGTDPGRKPRTALTEKQAGKILSEAPGKKPTVDPKTGPVGGKPPDKASAENKAGNGTPSPKPGSQKPASPKPTTKKPASPKPADKKPGQKPDALKKGDSLRKDAAKVKTGRDAALPPAPTGISRAGFFTAILAVILVVVLVYNLRPADKAEDETVAGPTVGGPFTLVDTNGRTVTQATYRGRFMLIYFGYTYCPDVCPTALTTIADALDILGAGGEKVQPIFITIDPERDTVEGLKEFVRFFHPRQVALTGTAEQVSVAAKAYRAYYSKGKASEGDPDDYLMEHSSIIYLMGPNGDYRTHFVHGTTAEEMAKRIREFL